MHEWLTFTAIVEWLLSIKEKLFRRKQKNCDSRAIAINNLCTVWDRADTCECKQEIKH
jgi:hypothetical protein